MRPGQSRRTRSRSRSSKGPNPLTRSYESNGPDVKVRGTAQHIADKYAQLARDAQSSGDPVAAENYYQHAEHYYRIIAAAQDQFRQQYSGGYGQRPFDDSDDDGEEEAGPNGFPYPNGERQGPAPNDGDGDLGNQPQPYGAQPQPYESRDDRSHRNDRHDRGGGSDRYDRGSRSPDGGRPPERNDRNDRFDRGPRPPERNERYERPDRDRGDPNARRDRDDRGTRPPERSERTDRPERADRPERTDRFERPDRVEPAPRPEIPRGNRDDSRRDGQRDERRREEADEPTGLPAFLTNPVRAPIAAVEEPVTGAPASTGPEIAASDGEESGRSSKPRRRRRTRYEGPGEEGAPDGAAPASDPTPVE